MITIVGAGPAGSYLAYLLAKKGKDVTIIEEHKKIGDPVQCTGIVTGSIEKFVKLPKNVVANRCSRVIVVSKNKSIVANTDEIVLWRDKFDQFIADMAADQGVKILTNHQFLNFNGSYTNGYHANKYHEYSESREKADFFTDKKHCNKRRQTNSEASCNRVDGR